ncbi:hypothetical protein [Thalassotalea euphylliae]|uniref:Uncharacterized protein n=1 Tax=Thalassotalea euphylliae TaxID=1655234 RepID=A0A3E0U427_9GAMM|nr:hypothetical protein [Thalassotalea euphylliae]REL30732.1 hypothetical protein DXX94_08390 [Thalassotalea euphylliae]
MKLPIRIAAEQQVSDALNITKHDLERIEAWANFETLKANWYGDEANSPSCQIALVSPEYFQAKFGAAADATQGDHKGSAEVGALAGWQINGETLSAVKFVDLASKQLIFIAISESLLVKQLTDQESVETSQWIGTDHAVKLQQIIRYWLLQLAAHFNLDAID